MTSETKGTSELKLDGTADDAAIVPAFKEFIKIKTISLDGPKGGHIRWLTRSHRAELFSNSIAQASRSRPLTG